MATTDPVPSKNPADLLFNAEKLDQVVNSPELTYLDRLGRPKDTVAGAIYKIAGITNRGAWAASTLYATKDIVQQGGTWYVAVVAHTSAASFATDQASKWRVYQGVTSGDLSADGGAALVGFKQAGTSAQLRDMLAKARESSVTPNDFYIAGEATFGPAIQRAEDYLNGRGGGKLRFPDALYTTSQKLLKKSFTYWEGAGVDGTTLMLANGVNDDLISVEGFSTLTGGSTLGGIRSCGIEGMTLDGNKANNTAGFGIRFYGKAYELKGLRIQNCKQGGLWSEYSGGDDFTTISKTLEATFSDICIQHCDGTGWEFLGPHDAVCRNIIIFMCGGWGWVVRTKSIAATNVNTYLCTSGGIRAYGDGAAIRGTDIVGSTATGWGCLLESGGHNFDGLFAGPIGLEVRANNNVISGAIGNTTTAGLKITTASGQGQFNLVMFNNTGVVFDVAGASAKSSVRAIVTDLLGTLQNAAFPGTWFLSGARNQNQMEGGLTVQNGPLRIPVGVTGTATRRFFATSESPQTGLVTTAFSAGDRATNSTPSGGGPKGWICVTSGTPGVWVSEGNL